MLCVVLSGLLTNQDRIILLMSIKSRSNSICSLGDTVRLKTLYKISQKINGTQNKFTVYRDHCRFCFRYMIAPSIAKEVQSLQEDKDIRALFDLRPKMYDQPTHPYVCVNWGKAARVKNLSCHLNFMSKRLGEKSKHAYSEEGYKLFSIEGNHGEHYDVRLCPGEWREGSLAISITNQNLESVYSTTFCITENDDLFIGCIQGAKSSVDNRSEVIKSLTKAQYGIRPKALIVELAMMFARYYGLSNVYCVSNKGHVYSASDFRSRKQRKKVMFDYDAFCAEMSGIRQNRYQFKLPLESKRRDLSRLNRTKRKMYNKRYELLEKYEEKIKVSLAA